MLVQIQLERNSKMKTLLPSNIFSGSSDKSNGKEQGRIKAWPMTKALTIQFMNGFRAHPHFGGKAHTSPSVGLAVPFESGEGNQVCSQTVHRERG